MSSFKRKIKTDLLETQEKLVQSELKSEGKVEEDQKQQEITGTRPWIHNGACLVSSGHRQLDDLLGGGIPIGTSTLYISEDISTYSQTLLHYHIAESVSHQHTTLLVFRDGLEAETTLKAIPYNGSLGKDSNTPVEPLADGEKRDDWGLKIAWQYQKYLDNNRTAPKRVDRNEKIPFCCSYDLSRSIQPSCLGEHFSIHLSSPSTSFENDLHQLYQVIKDAIGAKLAIDNKAIVRVFFPLFHTLIDRVWTSKAKSTQAFNAVVLFLMKLKRLNRATRSVFVFGMPVTILSERQQLTLETIIDTVFSIDSFTSRMEAVPYEFSEFLGFFMIRKLQQFGMLTSPALKGTKYGIKRDRRKLHIEPLHLPPEESRATSSATAKEEKLNKLEESKTVQLKSEGHAATTATTITSTTAAVESKTTSSEISTVSEKTLTPLAQSLAAARNARAAAKAQSAAGSNIPKPVSISKKDGIDF